MKRRRKSKALPGINPNAFVLAAELIATGNQNFACNALWYATGRTTEDATNLLDWTIKRDALPEVRYLTALLKPEDCLLTSWYLHPVRNAYGHQMGEGSLSESRILGLLLAAELAKEGFQP